MSAGAATAKRLESEIARVLEIMGHVRDRPEGLNEADTKAAFIDPILSALGWELRDPFSVSQQYRHKPQDNPVHYALFILRAPVMFVEAKALTRDLSDYKWISQTLAYANAAGVEWCVLTNGDEYRIYNTFEGGGGEEGLPARQAVRPGRARLLHRHAAASCQAADGSEADRRALEGTFRRPPGTRGGLGYLPRARRGARSDDRQTDAGSATRRSAGLSEEGRPDATLPRNGNGRAPAPARVAGGACRLQACTQAFCRLPNRPDKATGTAGRRRDTGAQRNRGHVQGAAVHGNDRVRRPHPFRRADLLVAIPRRRDGPEQGQRPATDGRPYWSTNGWTFWHSKDPVTGRPEPISKWLESLG